MKKLIAALVIICLLCASACADTLAQEACRLAQRIDELADNDMYLKLMLSSEDVIGAAKAFGQGDRSQPAMMVSVDLSTAGAAMLDMIAREGVVLDQTTREAVMSRLKTSLLVSAVATRGTLTLAASSALTAGDFFAFDMEAGDGLFILFYEDACPVAVTWVAQKGAVSMSAMFLPLEELADCTTPEMVADWFASAGMEGAVVTPVE